MRLPVFSVIVAGLIGSLGRAAEEAPANDSQSPKAIAQRFTDAVDVLNRTYWSPTLQIWFDRPGDDIRAHYERRLNPTWWPSANAVEVLIDYMNATGDTKYDAVVTELYRLNRDLSQKGPRVVAELKRRGQWSEADEEAYNRRRARAEEAAKNPKDEVRGPTADYYSEFRNEYLDDTGWWGVTWLKMYERTKQPDYLATAKAVQAHMARNWLPDKGGGIMWCEEPDKQRPNSITNSLFVILSARLYAVTKEPAYLDWAKKTQEWMVSQALFDGRAVVDGPGHKDDHWTYNQGTYLGAWMALHRATGEQRYLDEAVKVAGAMLAFDGLVRPDGVIYERIGTSGDASLFKGVFLRYLAQMCADLKAGQSHPETAAKIETCIRKNVDSMLQHSLQPDGTYTVEWFTDAKDQKRDFNTQTSALCALAAWLECGKGSRGERVP